MMDLIAINLAVWFLTNIKVCMFVLAILVIVLNRAIVEKKISYAEIIYRWLILFCVVVPFLLAFVVHAWFPHLASVVISYTASPYHQEIALVDLVFVLFAAAAFKARYGYRLAMALLCASVLWVESAAKIYGMMVLNRSLSGSASAWLAVDIIVPLMLLLSVRKLKLK
jgi:hypothetical protein